MVAAAVQLDMIWEEGMGEGSKASSRMRVRVQLGTAPLATGQPTGHEPQETPGTHPAQDSPVSSLHRRQWPPGSSASPVHA